MLEQTEPEGSCGCGFGGTSRSLWFSWSTPLPATHSSSAAALIRMLTTCSRVPARLPPAPHTCSHNSLLDSKVLQPSTPARMWISAATANAHVQLTRHSLPQTSPRAAPRFRQWQLGAPGELSCLPALPHLPTSVLWQILLVVLTNSQSLTTLIPAALFTWAVVTSSPT